MTQKLMLFSKSVVYLVGLAALAVCFILLPELAREESVENSGDLLMTSLFLLGSYVLATPFFVALFYTLKLLKNIESGNAFSHQSINILGKIKRCTVVFSVLVICAVIAGIVLAQSIDPNEDVTFMVTFGFIFTFVSGVIAVFVAVLQRLLSDAVKMKSENDLIV